MTVYRFCPGCNPEIEVTAQNVAVLCSKHFQERIGLSEKEFMDKVEDQIEDLRHKKIMDSASPRTRKTLLRLKEAGISPDDAYEALVYMDLNRKLQGESVNK